MSDKDAHFESALVYVLLFSAFGMFMLAFMTGRYEYRQTNIENRFRGIQEMQRRAGGAEASTPITPTEDEGLLIRRQPLFFVIGSVMLTAWGVLMWRRARRRTEALSQTQERST